MGSCSGFIYNALTNTLRQSKAEKENGFILFTVPGYSPSFQELSWSRDAHSQEQGEKYLKANFLNSHPAQVHLPREWCHL